MLPPPTVKLLLDRGANVNAATKDGYTALHAASSFGRPEIIELLLSRGADRSALDKRKRTPLTIAEECAKRLPDQPRYASAVALLRGEAPPAAG